jgi:NhaA family Na+:H+ antiporter
VAGPARAGRALEAPVHRLSSYIVLPLFVLANGGVVLTGAVWHSSGAVSVLSAIITARLVGKLLGITLAVVLVVRLGLCGLPEQTTWRHMVGVSLLCGMGITVPLLFARAVFGGSSPLYSGAQLGLLFGTLGAAALGGLVLLTGHRSRPGVGPGSADPSRATVPATKGAPPAPPGDHDSKERPFACEPD